MAFFSFHFSHPFPSSSGTRSHCLHSDPSIIDLPSPYKNLRISRRRMPISFASTGHKTVQASWIPADGISSDGYGGWLIAEIPVAKKTRERPFLIFGAVAASMSILLAAAASRSMSRAAYKYRFNTPLHALQELFVQAGTMVPISAPVSSQAIQEESSSQMSDKVDDEYISASIEKMERVIIPVAPDSTQQEAVAVLKKLKIMEEDVTPVDLCTRREYARWIVKLNSLLERYLLNMVLNSCFILLLKALAEAGTVPSKLSANEFDPNRFKDQPKVEFLPESFLSRMDLVDWRAQLEYKLMPGMDEKMLMKKVAFMDVNYVAPNASPALLDLIGGEESICRKVFGNTRRLQPQKPATVAQAAVSLTVGRMREAIDAELSRIDAENSSRQAEMEEIRSEILLRGEIQKFWAEKMDEEKAHRLEVEQDFQMATHDLEKEKIAQDESMADFLKEKAVLDCQRGLLLSLNVEVNEMREKLAAERVSFVAEQLSLGQLVAELQSKLEVLVEAKSRLEAEKEALRILSATSLSVVSKTFIPIVKFKMPLCLAKETIAVRGQDIVAQKLRMRQGGLEIVQRFLRQLGEGGNGMPDREVSSLVLAHEGSTQTAAVSAICLDSLTFDMAGSLSLLTRLRDQRPRSRTREPKFVYQQCGGGSEWPAARARESSQLSQPLLYFKVQTLSPTFGAAPLPKEIQSVPFAIALQFLQLQPFPSSRIRSFNDRPFDSSWYDGYYRRTIQTVSSFRQQHPVGCDLLFPSRLASMRLANPTSDTAPSESLFPIPNSGLNRLASVVFSLQPVANERRLGFLVVASIIAYSVKKLNCPRQASLKFSENVEKRSRHHQVERERKQVVGNDTAGKEHVDKQEEEGEVKRIHILDSPSLSSSHIDDEHAILSEFEEFISEETEFLQPNEKFDLNGGSQAEKDNGVYEIKMAKDASELEHLRNLVRELEDRDVKHEGELLEYYALKEDESDIEELQKQLKVKTAEIDNLNTIINSLQAEKMKLQEEIAQDIMLREELEMARNKIKELQRKIQLDANQTRVELLMLKQQITRLQVREAEGAKKEGELMQKLKSMKELEVEVTEMRRRNKELQHETRELIVKLDAREARITGLSNGSENLVRSPSLEVSYKGTTNGLVCIVVPESFPIMQIEMVSKAREEVNNLKHANEDLSEKVEGLQMNRFSEVEELVYLRWVNACLRYELRSYQAPAGKISARDLNRSLSPKSQEKAKQLMQEYAGSKCGQGDTDVDSISSHLSSSGSDDFENTSMDSSSNRQSNMSKTTSLIRKLKKWGKSRDDSTISSSRSLGGVSPITACINHGSSTLRGPLEPLIPRNAGDGMAITTFGKRDDPTKSPNIPSLLCIRTQVSSSDPLNTVASSFQLMSKSVEGVLEDKYPACKDRHKLALERSKTIKVRAAQARMERFGDGYNQISNTNVNSELTANSDREKPVTLPPKFAQINEKVVSNLVSSDSSEQSNDKKNDTPVVSKMRLAQLEKRATRVPRPPPNPSGSGASSDPTLANPSSGIPPPPPLPSSLSGGPARPPPPPGCLLVEPRNSNKVHRAPELVQFYQSLVKREAAKKDTESVSSATFNASHTQSNMIGEIEYQSDFLLAVKADVETQREFVQFLATEVRSASFNNIEDLVSFVNWLDEELSFLVDECAVLKHFDWPEGKADALREATFEYQDLVKLEKLVSFFIDDPQLSCESALKKMYSLLEKLEQSVYALLWTREMAISRYQEFGIPVDWLMDSGVVGKIKLSSIELARRYMKRVALELDALSGPDKEPNREFLILQGVRFSLRVHQFAGGFDAETMHAFEELRNRAR
ncbi:hypothetical protein ACLOJK_032375 [Asimina triloba]